MSGTFWMAGWKKEESDGELDDAERELEGTKLEERSGKGVVGVVVEVGRHQGKQEMEDRGVDVEEEKEQVFEYLRG